MDLAYLVQEKRSLLRESLHSEYDTAISSTLPLDPVSEFYVCSNKLEDLKTKLEKFDVDNFQDEYARFSARLAHLKNRIPCIIILDKEAPKQNKNMHDACLKVITQLKLKFSAKASALLLAEQEQSRSEEPEEEPQEISTPPRAVSSSSVPSMINLDLRLTNALEMISQPFAQSRIESGSTRQTCWCWFIEFLGESGKIRVARGESKASLFNSSVDLFKGKCAYVV